MIDDAPIFRTERTLPYPALAVYEAFASAETLASWWGPDGFTNTFEIFEFAAGGRWKIVMHGPDGKHYPNTSVFAALASGEMIAIRHDCLPFFTLTVRLKRVAGGTHLTWEQAFDDAATAQAVRHIVEPANEQNLNRLERTLARGAGVA